MSFDNSTMKPPRKFKPHIALICGYWRVSQSLHERFPGYAIPEHIAKRWRNAHTFAREQNAAREFGMSVPGTT